MNASGTRSLYIHPIHQTTEDSTVTRLIDPIPQRYINLAIETLTEHDAVLGSFRIALMAKAGLIAQAQFYAAALYAPSPQEMDCFFVDFILRCVLPSGLSEA